MSEQGEGPGDSQEGEKEKLKDQKWCGIMEGETRKRGQYLNGFVRALLLGS